MSRTLGVCFCFKNTTQQTKRGERETNFFFAMLWWACFPRGSGIVVASSDHAEMRRWTVFFATRCLVLLPVFMHCALHLHIINHFYEYQLLRTVACSCNPSRYYMPTVYPYYRLWLDCRTCQALHTINFMLFNVGNSCTVVSERYSRAIRNQSFQLVEKAPNVSKMLRPWPRNLKCRSKKIVSLSLRCSFSFHCSLHKGWRLMFYWISDVMSTT